jgi:hypothetical protein
MQDKAKEQKRGQKLHRTGNTINNGQQKISRTVLHTSVILDQIKKGQAVEWND